MTNCSEILGMLDGYLDGELTVGERTAVAMHLASCSRCQLAMENRKALALAVKSSVTRLNAPSSITLVAPLRPGIALRWVGMISASLPIFAGITFLTSQWLGSREAAKFQNALIASYNVENGNVSSCDMKKSNPIEVKKWLQGQGITFIPHGLVTADPSLKLKDVTTESIEGHRGVHLKYKFDGRLAEVFATADPVAITGKPSGDIHVKTWISCGITYFAMRLQDKGELDRFVSSIQ